MAMNWQGENPFYLLISLADGTGVVIDLDKRGWATEFADYFRVKAYWGLLDKNHHFPVLQMVVNDGDQPYYTARHFAATDSPSEVIAYGIGKKREDGHTDRLWAFREGMVCCGDDVDVLGRLLLDQLKFRAMQRQTEVI